MGRYTPEKSESDNLARQFFEDEDPNSLGGSRQDDLALLKHKGLKGEEAGIARLVAFTVRNQLYTYWRKAERHIEKFRGKTGLDISPRVVKAYLVMPAAQRLITERVMGYFPEVGISCVGEWQGIVVFEISYAD